MIHSKRSRGFTMIDVLVAVFVILMISTFSLAQLGKSRETANRVKCASNLKQIGMAMLLYANENRGAYPRGIYDEDKTDKPMAFTHADAKLAPDESCDAIYCKAGPGPNDVTAGAFRLTQTEDINAAVFLCPSVQSAAGHQKPDKIDPKAICNFPDASHLDYSFANPYPSKEAAANGYKLSSALSAEFALAADINPGIADLTKTPPDAPQEQLSKINSTSHDGDGQNVLYGDGHIEFVQSPYCGVHHDNIYTYGRSGLDENNKSLGGGDGIVGSPVDADDSVLLPTSVK